MIVPKQAGNDANTTATHAPVTAVCTPLSYVREVMARVGSADVHHHTSQLVLIIAFRVARVLGLDSNRRAAGGGATRAIIFMFVDLSSPCLGGLLRFGFGLGLGLGLGLASV